jgi:hypothetical protein
VGGSTKAFSGSSALLTFEPEAGKQVEALCGEVAAILSLYMVRCARETLSWTQPHLPNLQPSRSLRYRNRGKCGLSLRKRGPELADEVCAMAISIVSGKTGGTMWGLATVIDSTLRFFNLYIVYKGNLA